MNPSPFPARPNRGQQPGPPLRYVAKGTFRDGSKYIRFPQAPPSKRTTLFLLYPDGAAGIAEEGELAKFFPAGTGDAELIHRAHKTLEAGELPHVPKVGQ